VSVPEHLWRFPTAAAIDALAKRFALPNTPQMQDWPWEVADPGRLDEFLEAYLDPNLNDDERFTLMEIMLQSFEDLGVKVTIDPRWHRALDILDQRIDLHAYSVWYWSDLENDNRDEQWRVTPFLRQVLAKHRDRLENP
jgi:hypothetical protein